jgi:hypothetical protein
MPQDGASSQGNAILKMRHAQSRIETCLRMRHLHQSETPRRVPRSGPWARVSDEVDRDCLSLEHHSLLLECLLIGHGQTPDPGLIRLILRQDDNL